MNKKSAALQNSVLVFGEVLYDIFPDAEVLGGAPFNVARHLAGFGTAALLVSRVGRDQRLAPVLEACSQFGMDVHGLQLDPRHPTGQVMVNLESGEPRFDILPDQAYDHIHAGLARLTALSAHPRAVYFGSLAARSPTARRALQGVLRLSPGLKFLDVNLRAPWYERSTVEWLLRQAQVVKLNLPELEVLRDWLKLTGSPEAVSYRLLKRYDLRMLLLTRGAQGAQAATLDGQVFDLPGTPLDEPLIDSVGAGDAFAAVAIHGLLEGWRLPTILARADRFARRMLHVRGAVPKDHGIYGETLQEWAEEKHD